MNTIRKRLNQKLLSQLEGNIAINSDGGSIYIDGNRGTISAEKIEVATTLVLSSEDWMYVLEDAGRLGALIVSGKAVVKGDIGLAFRLSELIG